MENWTKTELRNVLRTSPQYGANASAIDYLPDENLRFVRITDIDDSGRLKEDGKVGISLENGSPYILEEDDIIIARTGATVGKALRFKEIYGKCAFAGYLIRFKIDEVKFNINFFNQYLLSPFFKRWIQDNLRAGAQPNVNAEEYQSVILPNPPLAEQKKIAEILSTWDKSIETTEKLIAAKQKLKKSLMQRLLTGSQRFPEFHGQEWKKSEISDFTKQAIRIRNKPDKPFLAMGIRSHGKGTFLKPDFEPSKIDMTELFEVKENDLIVNITFAWEGAIAIVGRDDEGALVSHRFPTYEFQIERMIPEFFRYVIRQKEFVERLGIISPGGAGRNRVLSKKDFVKLEIKIPKVEEQKKIAAVLNACDAEINVLQTKLAALQQQKRGLMQKLLTGRVRVKLDENSNAAFEN
jgi:type I restriction enzyme S subunit